MDENHPKQIDHVRGKVVLEACSISKTAQDHRLKQLLSLL